MGHGLGIEFLRRAGSAATWIGLLNILLVATVIFFYFLLSFAHATSEYATILAFLLICLGIGTLQCAMAYRSTLGIRRQMRSRVIWVIRISAIALWVVLLLGFVIAELPSALIRHVLIDAPFYLFICFLIALVPLVFGLGRHYGAICEDIGEGSKASAQRWMSGIMAFGFGAMLLTLMFVSIFDPLGPMASFAETLTILGGSCLGFLCGSIGFLGWTILLLTTGASLREAAKNAQSATGGGS